MFTQFEWIIVGFPYYYFTRQQSHGIICNVTYKSVSSFLNNFSIILLDLLVSALNYAVP